MKETPKHFQKAMSQIGVKEIKGGKHNPKILEYHAETSLKATTDEVPWCSSFVSWCLEKVGIPSTRNAWARSYVGWGEEITEPAIGDIVIFKRGKASGHVAFYFDTVGDEIIVLGGNQNNEVNLSRYPKSKLIGFRRWKSSKVAQ